MAVVVPMVDFLPPNIWPQPMWTSALWPQPSLTFGQLPAPDLAAIQ